MNGIIYLIGFYLLGELLTFLLGLPIPGSVVGLLLTIAFMASAPERTGTIRAGAGILLRFLPLFLVPIGVGLLNIFAEAKLNILGLSLVTLASLVVGVVITATVMRLLMRFQTQVKPIQENEQIK